MKPSSMFHVCSSCLPGDGGCALQAASAFLVWKAGNWAFSMICTRRGPLRLGHAPGCPVCNTESGRAELQTALSMCLNSTVLLYSKKSSSMLWQLHSPDLCGVSRRLQQTATGPALH